MYDEARFELWAPFHPQPAIDGLLVELCLRRIDADVDLEGAE